MDSQTLAIILGWIGSGLLGSWMVLAATYREPWFDPASRPSLLSPFPLVMALLGPFNLFCGLIYAGIFRKP